MQYVRHSGLQGMRLSSRPYDVLRIYFCDPALALPTCAASGSDEADDFNDNSVFDDPEVIAALTVTK